MKCLWNLTEWFLKCYGSIWHIIWIYMRMGQKLLHLLLAISLGGWTSSFIRLFLCSLRYKGFDPCSPHPLWVLLVGKDLLIQPYLSIDSSCDIFPYKNCWVKAVLHQLCDTFGEISWIFPRHLDWLDFKATQVAKSRPLRQNSGFFHITFGWFLDDFGMSKVTLW